MLLEKRHCINYTNRPGFKIYIRVSYKNTMHGMVKIESNVVRT